MSEEPTPDDQSQDSADAGGRSGGWMRLALGAGLVVALICAVQMLPVGAWIETLTAKVESLGAWAPVVFGLAYVAAALLFVPGAALTIAAGAIFGLFQGMVVVSVASTVSAALAFVIGRHFLRDAIEQRAERSPKFAAIDKAIAKGGWRIVAMLRLSPVMPFSLGNYLYGLTGVRFGPYLLTSWLAMIPGTFLYVYLGHAGRAGLEAAEGRGGRSAGEWALLGVGLAATLAVTIYVTRLARQAMQDEQGLDADAIDRSDADATDNVDTDNDGSDNDGASAQESTS